MEMVMVIIGVILMVLGVGSAVFGFMQNNSIEAQLTSIFGSGRANPGTTWIVIGIAALVIGIVLMIIGLRKKKN